MEPTRERILFAALQLFGEKGFLSTSIADILRAAEANAGSLYHFFPTKQDLLIAVLETYRDGIYPMLIAPAWAGETDPIARIFALLGRYRQLLEASDCAYGCPIGSLALELHEPDPPVRDLLSENFTGWATHVRACLDDAEARLPPDLDRGKLALFILTTMEGGVMQSRTHRTLDAFDACVDMLADYLTRLQRASTAGAHHDDRGNIQ